MISIYGSTGFIGSRYVKLYEKDALIIPREQLIPTSENILYFISTTNNYHVLSDPFLDIDTNLTLLIKTLEACKKQQKKTGHRITFNFISSWFVYGNTNLPAKESAHCNPKGFYSITKKTAEDLLISYCKTFDMDYRVLRLSNVIGSKDDFSKEKNALQYLIEEIKNHRKINLYFEGDFIRDYLHVDDICLGIYHCIKNGSLNEKYNIGRGQPLVFRELMDYMIKKLNSNSTIDSIDLSNFQKIIQIKDCYLDINKIKNLGFCPQYSIWESLDKLI